MRRKHHQCYQGGGVIFVARLASLARFLITRAAAGALLALATLLAAPIPAQAQGEPQLEPCPGGSYNPTPTAVDVEAVPIVVESTAADYFVLYVRHDVDGAEVELPVLVKKGAADTTTLAENVEALPKERYRVEKYLVADPADIDGDCIDDITELDDLGNMNPVNPAAALDFSDGAVAIPDRETFEALFVALPNGEFHGKFVLLGKNTARPGVYIQNSRTHRYHYNFLQATDIDENLDGMLVGQIAYYPKLVAPDGSSGVYVYRYTGVTGLRDYYPFSIVAHTYTALAASMPLIEDNLAYHMPNRMLPHARDDLPLYEDSRINRVFDADVLPKTGFLALNPGEGYGFLRVMDPDERPHPRDIVIYEALPNELPRVAGIVSTVPNPDAAVACQPARRSRRRSQRLHPRRPRLQRYQCSDRRLRPL